jgi:hypothetical protein
MRVEGLDWVAYAAHPNTMQGAVEMGRIKMALVQRQEPKNAFMGVMMDGLQQLIAENGGTILNWNDPVAAPEHERSGRA